MKHPQAETAVNNTGQAAADPPSSIFAVASARQVGATRRRIVNLSGALTKFMRANIVRA